MLQRLLPACFALALVALPAHADELTPAKQADIKRLMEIRGSANIPRQMANLAGRQVFGALRQMRPETPTRIQGVIEGELFNLFSERVGQPGGLIDQMVPVYAKHYSHPEVQELLRFYQTPLGKKTIAAEPAIGIENLQLSQKWIQVLSPEIDKRVTEALRKQGITPDRPAAAPNSGSAPAGK